MPRSLILVVVAALPLLSAGTPPEPPSGLPVGTWAVEFANGVKQVTDVRRDGTVKVTEPGRSSRGKAADRGGRAVILYDDDRGERWTRVGNRWVVEHWYPASDLPTGTPVLGIAEELQ